MRKREPVYIRDKNQLPEILTVATMANFMHVSEQTILNRIKAGALPAFRDGKLIRIRRSDALAFLGISE